METIKVNLAASGDCFAAMPDGAELTAGQRRFIKDFERIAGRTQEKVLERQLAREAKEKSWRRWAAAKDWLLVAICFLMLAAAVKGLAKLDDIKAQAAAGGGGGKQVLEYKPAPLSQDDIDRIVLAADKNGFGGGQDKRISAILADMGAIKRILANTRGREGKRRHGKKKALLGRFAGSRGEYVPEIDRLPKGFVRCGKNRFCNIKKHQVLFF